MAVDREFYVYRFGRPRTGRTDGRTGGRAGGRTDGGRTGGRAAGTILNDSTTIFIDFHKKHPKTLCFSVVSRPAEAQVPIFTAQMKKASKKCQKSIVFFDFSNHAGAQVPIFTPKMKNFRFARPARPSTRKWDFRRRSRPRELAQRSQDDVSLNKLPQIIYLHVMLSYAAAGCAAPRMHHVREQSRKQISIFFFGDPR